MTLRSSLSVKIILLAFLNVLLLGVIVAVFARIEYRVELGSFLYTPTRDRILSVSRLVALELPNRPQAMWDQSLDQYSQNYPAKFFLFDGEGRQLAGAPVSPPQRVLDFITQNHHGPPGQPILFTHVKDPTMYWVATHIPLWKESVHHPVRANLVWQFPSFWTEPFFFDYRPWLLGSLAVIIVSLICWVPLIRGLTRSISDITRATGQIAEGHFEIALSTRRKDELGRLSRAINRMAERLSSYVHGQKRFLSDVAHELCSPVARMQMALGILEQRAGEGQKTYVRDVQEEAEHMSGLINELLSFSKSQIGSSTKDLTRVNVADTVQSVLERESSPSVVIETQLDQGLEVMAQPDFLFRSLANLVRNAVRYAGHAGPIQVSASSFGQDVSIRVSDQGPGVPDAEIEEIFKPFYRPEFARQRETGGSGLGLAIVKSCIEACGGIVRCRNRSPQGLEVEIRLPAPAN
jgi:two-component system, OmpR family, sensor histidine kinase CpxA